MHSFLPCLSVCLFVCLFLSQAAAAMTSTPYRCRLRSGGVLTAGSRAALCRLPAPMIDDDDDDDAADDAAAAAAAAAAAYVVAVPSIAAPAAWSSADGGADAAASTSSTVTLLAWPSGAVLARVRCDSEPVTAAALCAATDRAALELFVASRSLTMRHLRIPLLRGRVDQVRRARRVDSSRAMDGWMNRWMDG